MAGWRDADWSPRGCLGQNNREMSGGPWKLPSVPNYLHRAAETGNLFDVGRLLDNGADMNSTDDFGYKPLHLAAKKGHPKAAELLLQKKADVNATDGYRFTPLHTAAQYRHHNVAELLLQKKADVNAKNSFGETPLIYAQGHTDLVELLQRYEEDKDEAEEAEEAAKLKAEEEAKVRAQKDSAVPGQAPEDSAQTVDDVAVEAAVGASVNTAAALTIRTWCLQHTLPESFADKLQEQEFEEIADLAELSDADLDVLCEGLKMEVKAKFKRLVRELRAPVV